MSAVAVTSCVTAKRDWEQLAPHERTVFLRRAALYEVQKYWKRLRRAGASFKYLVTFEEDQAGRPHMHCLLHETDPDHPARKRDFEEAWGLGFTKFRLLRLTADGDLPYRAIAYVAKSLALQHDTRLCASTDYRPERQFRQTDRPRQLKLTLS